MRTRATKQVTITLTTDNLNALDVFRLGEQIPFSSDDDKHFVIVTVTEINAVEIDASTTIEQQGAAYKRAIKAYEKSVGL